MVSRGRQSGFVLKRLIMPTLNKGQGMVGADVLKDLLIGKYDGRGFSLGHDDVLCSYEIKFNMGS